MLCGKPSWACANRVGYDVVDVVLFSEHGEMLEAVVQLRNQLNSFTRAGLRVSELSYACGFRVQ